MVYGRLLGVSIYEFKLPHFMAVPHHTIAIIFELSNIS